MNARALLVREKAHTRAGDTIAAARRRLPMTEVDASATLVGQNGPVAFLDVFDGRDQLIAYKHMWHTGAGIAGQCEGCTASIFDVHDASYLNHRGVSFAVFCEGPWEEIAPFRAFMGYTLPWYSMLGSRRSRRRGRAHRRTWLHRLLPARRRPGLPHQRDSRSRRRGHHAASPPPRPDGLWASGGLGGLAGGLAAGSDLRLVDERRPPRPAMDQAGRRTHRRFPATAAEHCCG